MLIARMLDMDEPFMTEKVQPKTPVQSVRYGRVIYDTYPLAHFGYDVQR